MRTLRFATALVSLCLVPCAHGQEMIRQELLTVGGAKYRLSGVNGSFIAHPEGAQPDMLTLDQSLARCDELVAVIIARAAPAGRKAPFVRDRTVPLRHGLTWVEYSQRHQGYRIVGGGGRIELNAAGGISFAGLQYESETFPSFKPRDLAALARAAKRAVPRPITGPPLQAELMIDPNGGAPARLMYYITYPVRERGHDGGWQVSVDAVTGKVLRSATTSVHAAAAGP
jgi:hypothetical protein